MDRGQLPPRKRRRDARGRRRRRSVGRVRGEEGGGGRIARRVGGVFVRTGPSPSDLGGGSAQISFAVDAAAAEAAPEGYVRSTSGDGGCITTRTASTGTGSGGAREDFILRRRRERFGGGSREGAPVRARGVQGRVRGEVLRLTPGRVVRRGRARRGRRFRGVRCGRRARRSTAARKASASAAAARAASRARRRRVRSRGRGRPSVDREWSA